MRTAGRSLILALIGAAAAILVGCGGADGPGTSPTATPLDYRSGLPLEVRRVSSSRQGPLKVLRLTYRGVDGERVPALFSVPASGAPLGCLIYVGGFGSTKTAPLDFRVGLGALRLATFSIDPRNLGDRGSLKVAAAALATPEGARAMLAGTVADLRMGVDYLSQRQECAKNIAIAGTSFGGSVSTLVAAQDPRIKAAIVTSLGATFKQFLLVRPAAASAIPGLPVYLPKTASDPKALRAALNVLSPYDNKRWIGRIAPRPVMILNGRWDPLVTPGDALELQAAAGFPKTVAYYNGGHDPFAAGPDRDANVLRAVRFLISSMNLPYPL